jgi:hypothetical protein
MRNWAEELILPKHCKVLITRGGTKKIASPCENLKLKFSNVLSLCLSNPYLNYSIYLTQIMTIQSTAGSPC